MAKQRYELWAESMREIGILLLVFSVLDPLLLKEHGGWKDGLVAFGFAILGLALIVKGVRMESDR